MITGLAIFFVVIVLAWIGGVWAAGYHVFTYRFPGDATTTAFIGFLVVAGALFLFALNWFFAALFGAIG